MAKMTDADLRELVRRRRDASVKHQSDNHAAARKEALQFYRGDSDLAVYGDSGGGLSTVVSRDLFEATESTLPALIKPFVSGDEAVKCEPTEANDEESAKQATEYLNWRFGNDNRAFSVIYDFTKDGLLYRMGVAKVVYELVDESDIETLTGLDEMQYQALDQMVREDKSKEILDDPEQDETGITCRVKTQASRGTYRVYVVAPEEFLFEDRLSTLEDATYLGHKPTGGRSVGDLIAMGLPKSKCMKLQGLVAETLEADDRFGWDEDRQHNYDDDDLARKVSVDDNYVRVDYEGTGSLQWRRVVLAGSDDTILLNEPVEDHPFVTWTPIPIPHKLVGYSLHDTTRDIQIQKTVVLREAFNALYLANRPQREVVASEVNIEDLLSPRVGGLVRVKQPGQIREIASGGDKIMAQSAAMIEYMDTVREQRTGSTRYNQGMDANSLNKTATGISMIQNASMQRQEVISRQLAEAVMQIFKKMLGLVSRYADKKEYIRLRGKFVEVDPREWRTGYDMTVSVGLGTGNKDQMAAHLTNLMGVQEQIAQAQGGLNGPVVKWENVYEAASRLTENLGLKGVERYFTDPSKQDPQDQQAPQQPEGPPQLDPMQQQAAEHELEMAKAHLEAQTKIEVARIGAEKDIIIAGMQPPPELMAPADYMGQPQVPDELGGDMA